MAKGKSFLGLKRGQAAGLVYSVGVDGVGKKQQVVRGLAETIANPQSDAQAIQRSQLAAASVMAAICREFSDHSVEGYTAGLAGRAQFIKMLLNPTGTMPGMCIPYVAKGDKAVTWQFGGYIQISKGSLPSYQELIRQMSDSFSGDEKITVSGNITANQIAQWGLRENDILTQVLPIQNSDKALVAISTSQYRVQAGKPLPTGVEVHELVSEPVDGSDPVRSGVFYVKFANGVTIHERVENGVKLRSNCYLQSMVEDGRDTPTAAVIATYQSTSAAKAWQPKSTYLDGSNL